MSTDNRMNTDEDNIVFGLDKIDSIIVLIYLLSSIGLGLYLGWKHRTAADYFLASRSTAWPFVGLTLFASNISSPSLVGLSGDAYNAGISVYNYEWMAAIILNLFATLYLPTILKSRLYTMPEFLERRYNSFTRCYFSLLTIFLNIVVDITAGLYAGALVVKMIFPQLETMHTVAIVAVLAGIYTISGGLAVVIYTDALQVLPLLLGSLFISIYTLYTLYKAGSWNAMKEKVPANHLNLIRPINDPSVPWTALITGLPLLEFYYCCINQTIAQRVLSSRNVKHGQWGSLLAGFLKLSMLFIVVLPGAMAIIYYPDLPKGDLVYLTLMSRRLPVGVLGLVLSGFIANLMSKINSTLNSASTLITMDFAKKFMPDLSERQLVNIGRSVTFLFMLASFCWAPLLEKFSSLFRYFQIIISYLIPPVVALYIGGFFWKGATARGAMLALILGNVWGIILFVIVEIMEWINIHFLHVAALLFALSFMLLVGESMMSSKGCTEDQLKVMWSSQQFIEDTNSLTESPFWQKYLLYCLLLVILTGIIVECFW